MAARTKLSEVGSTSGQLSDNGSIVGSSVVGPLSSRRMDDTIPFTKPGGSPFTMTHIIHVPGAINGATILDPNKIAYSFPIDRNPVGYLSHLSDGSRPSNAYLMTKFMANTNPSRPYVDIPVFLGELRDIPSLVYSFGRNMLTAIANGNIRYQFGIKPMISDLVKMTQFTKEADKRFHEFTALGKGGIRRKSVVWSGAVSSKADIFMISSPNWARLGCMRTIFTSRRVSAYCVWKPDTFFRSWPKTNDELRKKAMDAVTGATIDMSTAWELIPWSWLADWFGNVGDMLAANRNIIPAYVSHSFIMEHLLTQVNYTISTPSPWAGIQVSQLPSRLIETKSRQPQSAAYDARMPVLTGRQLSILGSLAALKGGGISNGRFNPAFPKLPVPR